MTAGLLTIPMHSGLRLGMSTCILALLIGIGLMGPCQLDAQRRLGLSAGIFASDVGTGDAVSAATLDAIVLFRSDRYVTLRSYWWRDSPQVWALGLYWGGRLRTRRYLFGELGAVTTGRRAPDGGLRVRPGLGFGAGFVIDPPGYVQVKIGTNIVRDTGQGFYSVGFALCLCPSVQ